MTATKKNEKNNNPPMIAFIKQESMQELLLEGLRREKMSVGNVNLPKQLKKKRHVFRKILPKGVITYLSVTSNYKRRNSILFCSANTKVLLNVRRKNAKSTVYDQMMSSYKLC